MKRATSALGSDCTGSAAVEMALVIPLLAVLLFGATDLGNYFLSEHVVQKSVRDAARYAARLPLEDSGGTVNYDCTGMSVGSSAQQQIQRVARYGDPSGSGTARLRDWTTDTMATVTLTCDSNTSDTYVNKGVYSSFPNGGAVPMITVSATVPYTSLFGGFGLGSTSYSLNARSQAAVIGA